MASTHASFCAATLALSKIGFPRPPLKPPLPLPLGPLIPPLKPPLEPPLPLEDPGPDPRLIELPRDPWKAIYGNFCESVKVGEH